MGIVQTNLENNDEISFREMLLKVKEWLNFFKLNIKSIFIATIIGIVVGLLYSYLSKPNYKAILTFAMEDDKSSGTGQSGLSGAIGLASSFGIDLGGAGGGAFAASNIGELMKSKLIVKKVLLNHIKINNDSNTLADLYLSINNPDINFYSFKEIPPNTLLNRNQDSLLNEIYKKLVSNENLNVIQKDKKVSILTIEVKSKNEIFSKVFCENLATETSNFYIQTKSKKARLNVEVLQKQVDSVRRNLNSAISGVASEVDAVYNLNPALNLKTTPSKKKQVDVQSNSAILTNLSVQLELAKISLRKETPLIQLIDSPTMPLEIDGFTKLQIVLIFAISSTFTFLIFIILKKLISDINL